MQLCQVPTRNSAPILSSTCNTNSILGPVQLVHFSSCFIHLDKQQRHEHCLDDTYSYFFETRIVKKAGSAW